MSRSWNYDLAMPALTELAKRLGIGWAPDNPVLEGIMLGDVLFWASWGLPECVKDDGHGRQRWEHTGMLLLVIGVHAVPSEWIEVKGVTMQPPHIEQGAWRWSLALVQKRLASGKLTPVASLSL